MANLEYCYGCMRRREPQETICPVCGYRHGKEQALPYALQPGSFLHDGKYLIGKVLGQGGFGITYVGLDTTLELKVAIKEYYPVGQVNRSEGHSELSWHTMSNNASAGRESFLKEARKMARVNAIPGIVQVRDIFYQNNTAYIVMNFVEGETLKTKLQREGIMTPEQCMKMLRPAMEAMEQVHRKDMVHRDISPDNIMIDPDGMVWILDLGAAKDLDTGNQDSTQSSQAVVKRGFSPPEQGIGKGIGPWTDVYAMSATIYYCLTGKLVPEAMDRLIEDNLSFPTTIPAAMADVLNYGLELKKENRIQSMREFLDQLEGCLGGSGQQKIPDRTRPQKSGTGNNRKQRTVFLAVAAVVILAAAVAGFIIGGKRQPLDTKTDNSEKPVTIPEETQAMSIPLAVSVGDIVLFGHYEQDNDLPNGQEPIEWMVLDVKDDQAMVISRYGLDAKPYNIERQDTTWEQCTLRSWLNRDFVNTAFSTEEQKAIHVTCVDNSKSQGNSRWNTEGGKDTENKIFLLSFTEAEKYFNGDEERCCKATKYALAQGAYVFDTGSYEDNCWYWLRSPGEYQVSAASVSSTGSLGYANMVNSNNRVVRPAFWINLNEAGGVSVQERTPDISKEEVTPVPSPSSVSAPSDVPEQRTVSVGDVVTFGHYEQDNDLTNGKEPIEWRVLDVKDDQALLISEYGLDAKPYNTTRESLTWETCSLRVWLNRDFFNTAFSTEEQKTILSTSVDNSKSQGNSYWNTNGGNDTKDEIFLLSYLEASQYFESDEDRSCQVTRHTTAQGAYKNSNGNCGWWLRSPGEDQDFAAFVKASGSLDYCSLVGDYAYVARPALWIDLNAGIL